MQVGAVGLGFLEDTKLLTSDCRSGGGQTLSIHREQHGEPRPYTLPAVDRYPALMSLDDLIADRKAQSSANLNSLSCEAGVENLAQHLG
jgi:hypothetical protein